MIAHNFFDTRSSNDPNYLVLKWIFRVRFNLTTSKNLLLINLTGFVDDAHECHNFTTVFQSHYHTVKLAKSDADYS